MTEYEHFMLQMCFNILLGFLGGMWLILITNTISNLKTKRKSRANHSDK